MDFKTWIEQKATLVFIILVIIQIVYLLGLFVADAIVNIEKIPINDQSNDQVSGLDDYYKWTVLFMFQISDCYYVFNAIYKCNVLELFAFITIEFITFLCTFARFYNLIEYTNKQKNLIVLAAFDYLYLIYSFCILILSIVCYKPFYDVFFYKNIMKVGASPDRQNMFSNYSNFSAFMKLYLLISLSTFVTFFFFFDTGYWYLYFIDSMVIILLVVSIFIGSFALRKENAQYFWIYLSLIIVIQVYILTKTTYYIVYKYQHENSVVSDQADSYTVMIVFGTTISCLTIMLFDIFYAFQCKKAFGNGLKEALKSCISEPGQELGESSYSQK